MENTNKIDMEKYAEQMDVKFADRGSDKLGYQDFKDQYKSAVEKCFQEKGAVEVEIDSRIVDKVNEKYDAMTVKPVGSDVGVNISITDAYEAYVNENVPIGDIADAAVTKTVAALENVPVISGSIDDFKNYDAMKDRLVMEVISTSANAEFLETVPHKDIEDMAVVYRFDVKDVIGDNASIIVTNQMLENYGITADQLHADAVKNAPEVRPLVIEGMMEVLAKQMGIEQAEMLGLGVPPEGEQIYVASVEGNVHGAGVIAYEDFMDKASERLGGQSFYLLPSSIHEVLIVPDNGKMDLAALEKMVREVNATTVRPEEKLTDNVYHYDSKDKIFELGEKHLLREAVKERSAEMGRDASEKKSLLGDLKAAKEEAAKQPVKDAVEKDVKSKGDVALG